MNDKSLQTKLSYTVVHIGAYFEHQRAHFSEQALSWFWQIEEAWVE